MSRLQSHVKTSLKVHEKEGQSSLHDLHEVSFPGVLRLLEPYGGLLKAGALTFDRNRAFLVFVSEPNDLADITLIVCS